MKVIHYISFILAGAVIMLLWINENRTVNLYLDDNLTVLALEHSKLMAETNELHHSDLSVVPGSYVGENVGVGHSLSDIQDALYESEGHKANLVDDKFNSVGIGIVYTDVFWVTQIFSDIESVHSEGILYVVEQDLMSGYPDGTFRPHEPITRGQLATVLKRMDENNGH